MKIRPMNGRVVVQPIETSETKKGGIIIPDSAQEKPSEGKIIAVAEDATEEVAVGDRVIYKEHSGTEVKISDKKYVLLEADDLLAKHIATDAIPD
ncbi:MAG: co-chaperone GroES [Lentisphaerae bacterium]|nr:co-chaperone GroES [Lentisphaerota bacterium]